MKILTNLQLLNMSEVAIENHFYNETREVDEEDIETQVLVGILIEKALQLRQELLRNNLEARCIDKYPDLHLDGLGLNSQELETILESHA